MKFQALNDSSISGDEDGDPELATREAQEEEAYSMYNLALKLQSSGNLEESEIMFRKILTLEFILQVQPQERDEDENEKLSKEEKAPLRPASNLKYLVYKNLASIYFRKEDYNSSVDCYLEALNIDASDVTMWYQAGLTALNLPNYSLSKLCFEEGLKCNPNHWLCLDNVITVTYALYEYANCLFHISKALERESAYSKGIALKNRIFEEDPSLKSFCEGYFLHCDPSVHTETYDKEGAEKFIKEALDLRERNRSLSRCTGLPVVQLTPPIKELSWKALGESLISTYDFITDSEKYSLCCKIDILPYTAERDDTCDTSQELESTSANKVLSESDEVSPPDIHEKGLDSSITPSVQAEPVHKEKNGISEAAVDGDDSPSASSGGLSLNPFFSHSEGANRCSDPLIYSDAPLGNRKSSKKKRLLQELGDFCVKRRSTRVRNPAVKRPQDNINYQEMLQQLLPPSLIGDCNFEDPDDYSDSFGKHGGDHTYGQTLEYKGNDGKGQSVDIDCLSSSEEADVQQFIKDNTCNGGLLDLLYKYVIILGGKSMFMWSRPLFNVYSSAFLKLRKHISMPNLCCHETDNKFIKEIGYAVLTFSELKVDEWYMSTGHTSSSSNSFSPKIPSVSASFQMGPDSIGKNFHADMEFLMQLTARRDVLDTDWLYFSSRVLWLKSKFHSVEGEVDLAVSCMERLTDVLQKEGHVGVKITVPNSSFTNTITLENVHQQLESLQRCQSLEELQRLYESGSYQSVVDLLTVTFGPSHSKPKVPSDGIIPERHAQLILLQDSLWKLESYKECVKWTEIAFNEALQQYISPGSLSLKNDWSDTMSHLLSGLERCIEKDDALLKTLDSTKLVRLTQNLILLVSLQLDCCEVSVESSLTALPWIVLYRIINNEESKDASFYDKSRTGKTSISFEKGFAETETQLLPSSIMVLITAHDYLGRRSCCCAADGMLLLHMINVLFGALNKPLSCREDLENALEQCFYCLYGHPNRRTKAKHLQEHNSQQIHLTWERAEQMYFYFKPSDLPTFDGYRAGAVSSELENLLRRIATLVPPDQDPSCRVDAYSAYIEGGTDKCPVFSTVPKPSVVVQDLYYLLGDFHFKSKDFSKAIRYYLMDICVNADRQDSWAGMALSRSSQIEQKLNSYEVKNESTIWRKSSAALRCFEHALGINPSVTSLWIEYGSLAYVLHSHASRQLKQNTYFDGPRDLLKVKKEEMLYLAERCFKEANKSEDGAIPEEAWLHHYMLGKIAQKQGKDVDVILSHFQRSLSCLHEDKARYPHKIQYHNPPDLSIEALEVFYRIHASCLKFLTRSEKRGLTRHELKVFSDCLFTVSSGPFMKFQEKHKTESAASSSISESEPEASQSNCAVNMQMRSTLDHNYFISSQPRKRKKMPDQDIPIQQCSVSSSALEEMPLDDAIGVVEFLVGKIDSSTGDESSESLIDKSDEFIPSDEYGDGAGQSLSIHLPAHEVGPFGDVFVEGDFLNTDDSTDDVKSEVMLSSQTDAVYNGDKPSVISTDTEIETTSLCSLEVNVLSSEVKSVLGSLSSENENDLENATYQENEIDFDKSISVSAKNNATILGDEIYADISYKVLKSVLDIVISEIVPVGAFEIIDADSGEKNDRLHSKYKAQDSEDFRINKIDLEENMKAKEVEDGSSAVTLKCTSDVILPAISTPSEDEAAQNLQIHDSLKKAVIPVSLDLDVISVKELEESKGKMDELITMCLNGLRECLKRFIQHYKSLYRIAYYYCYSAKNKNLQWAREVLLAATPAVKRYQSMPGLFAERKNTNFFNGIWRAPSNEIDRPGSFGAHMYRSVHLLIDVLSQQSDYNMLLYLTQQLNRTPDLGKKYMRDVERISLAKEAYESCVNILREQMNSLLQEEPPPEESRLNCCLLEIFRTYQTFVKNGICVQETNELLEEAYTMYKLGEVDPYPSVLDQAIRFCQLQLGKSYQQSSRLI